ncbi:unnamed protein product, partial [Bubo scandiacus]
AKIVTFYHCSCSLVCICWLTPFKFHHHKSRTGLLKSLRLNQPAFITACDPLWSEASPYQVASFLCVRV